VTTDPVVYTIADTHLGLRERGWERSSDAPAVVAGFLRWLSRLPPAGEAIPVLEPVGIGTRTLKPLTHLILLGDILELWDAENQTVLLSAASVVPFLASIQGQIVYVLGNHDNILEESAGTYPISALSMSVVPNVFPLPGKDGIVEPLQIGDQSYVFVHGHQLDRHFMHAGRTWRLLGHLRHIGAALGSYAWVFFGLMLLAVLSVLIVAPVAAAWLLLVALILLFTPRAYMTVGRRLWRRLFGTRYRRSAARDGFHRWWNRFREEVRLTASLAVVFGHTHVLDWFEVDPPPKAPAVRPQRDLAADAPERRREQAHAAYNISSWISAGGGYETVTSATLLYADAEGPLFLGWDWNAKKPFHIPFEFVSLRPTRRLSSSEAEIAQRLGWPEKLIEKWSRTDEKARTIWSARSESRRLMHVQKT